MEAVARAFLIRSLSTQMLSNALFICVIWGGSLFSVFGLKEECVTCKAKQIIQNINTPPWDTQEKLLKGFRGDGYLLCIRRGAGSGWGRHAGGPVPYALCQTSSHPWDYSWAAVENGPFWNAFRSKYWGLVSAREPARVRVNSCYFYCVFYTLGRNALPVRTSEGSLFLAIPWI